MSVNLQRGSHEDQHNVEGQMEAEPQRKRMRADTDELSPVSGGMDVSSGSDHHNHGVNESLTPSDVHHSEQQHEQQQLNQDQNEALSQNQRHLVQQNQEPAGLQVTWYQHLEQLLEYGRRHGHCNVRPPGIGGANAESGREDAAREQESQQLFPWLAAQRLAYRDGRLAPDMAARLQVLVDRSMLTWDGDSVYTVYQGQGQSQSQTSMSVFEDCFLTLVVYAETHGHCNVRPSARMTTVKRGVEVDMGAWLTSRRRERATGSLCPEFAGYLDILVKEGLLSWDVGAPTPAATDMPSNVVDFQWTRRFLRTREYVLRTGVTLAEVEVSALHLPLAPAADPEVERHCSHMRSFDVGLWLCLQRTKYANDSLRNDHYLRLQELVLYGAFNWFARVDRHTDTAATLEKIAGLQREEDALWTAWYNVVVWYGKRHGHCNVELKETVTLPDNSEAELGKWFHQQKNALKHCRIRLDRADALRRLLDRGLVNGAWKDILAQYHRRLGDVKGQVVYKQLLQDINNGSPAAGAATATSGPSASSASVPGQGQGDEQGQTVSSAASPTPVEASAAPVQSAVEASPAPVSSAAGDSRQYVRPGDALQAGEGVV